MSRRGCAEARTDWPAARPSKIRIPARSPAARTIAGARIAIRARTCTSPSLRGFGGIPLGTDCISPSPLAVSRYPALVREANFSSGDDYVVEFLGYRFSFNGFDFEQRVVAAGVRLGIIPGNDLDEDETADLVELVADGLIEEPRSSLGRYLLRHWEHLSLVNGESLVYWLRKLVFRSAWLDHRVKHGLLDVTWDED